VNSARNTLRLLAAPLCLLGVAALLTRNSSADPLTPATAPARGYYATNKGTGVDGGGALKACAVGYHMASMYELMDTSVLAYRRGLGFNQADSGNGPPWGAFGWVRTGNAANVGGADPHNSEGMSNCNNWISNSGADYGTMMAPVPPTYSITAPHYNMGPWMVVAFQCSSAGFVWCVQN
jgi:hypothetical protein